MPEPHLISSLEADSSGTPSSNDDIDSPFALGGERMCTGNGRAIFVGIVTGAIAISIAGSFYYRRHRLTAEEVHVPKILPAITERVFDSTHPNATPLPMVVQVDANVVRVSAIVLGHPRLAVVNGRTVAEGDSIVVHTPTRAVALTLRVLKISDGQIQLSDGTQVMAARLSIPVPSPAKQP